MRTPLRAAALALLWTAGCLGGSGGGAHAGYLDGAVNDGRVFRWTPLQGEAVELYVEMHDAPSELPGDFDGRFGPATLAGWVEDAVAAWLDAAGTPYVLDLRSHAVGAKHPLSRTVIHVEFVEGPYGSLQGTVTMTAGAQPTLVEKACLTVRVPPGSGQIPASAFRRLVRHEFGHLLGIIAFQPGPGTGHSPDPGDLMFPVIADELLSAADHATIDQLYRLQPDLRRADSVGASADPPPGEGATLWMPGVSLLPPVAAPRAAEAPREGPGAVLLQACCEG